MKWRHSAANISAILVTGLLSSCVTTIDRGTASRLSDAALCMQYGHWTRKGNQQAVSTVAAEIESRGGTAPDRREFNNIRNENLAIGMSECGMLAAMGQPDAQNSTVTATGKRTQYVFRPFAGRRGAYVYTEGGRVVAVQN